MVTVFDGMTVTLPTDGICALLGKMGSGRSTFLRLLSGAERPDRGEILSGTRFSIICNTGVYFHPGMTGIDNIKLAARLHGMDPGLLTELALGIWNVAGDWQLPARDLPGKTRKPMEMLVAALLPYGCYLVDDAERVELDFLRMVLQILRQRRAGMIFTTRNPAIVREFATSCAMVANHTVHAFESVEEALTHYA